MKTFLLAVAFFAILAALFSAGFFMLKRQSPDKHNQEQKSKRMAKALTVRIGLSIVLFAILLFSWKMGWIKQAGIPVQEQPAIQQQAK